MGISFEFRTRDYLFTYGHGPRGQGSWAFEIVGTISAEVPPELKGILWVPFSCTYSEAKREIKKLVKAQIKAEKFAHVDLNVLT